MNRKNACARFPKTTAVVFALLMLVPAFPVVAAEHAPDQLPDLVLPHAKPGDDCIPTGLSLEVFGTLGALQRGDTAYFAQDREVPVLCIDGRPQRDYVNLIERLDAELERFRDVLADLQSQYETRTERAVPEGDFPPRVTLLEDEFDGNRTGGIGDWTVITQSGEDPTWRLEQKVNYSVLEGSYRFGNNEGYPRGVREFLVSPELDLRAVRGNDALKQTLDFAKAEAKAVMGTACEGFKMGSFAPGSLVCENVVRELTGVDLVKLYEQQVDLLSERVPVGQEIATMKFSYRMNFADTQDGVRVWVYESDLQAPDRLTLFDSEFGLNSTRVACTSNHADTHIENQTKRDGARRELGNVPFGKKYNETAPNCIVHREGGRVIEVEGSKRTGAFAGSQVSSSALTGFTYDYTHVEVDLSNYAGKRIWVLFEAATMPDENMGGAYFDKAAFPEEQARYGFELANLTVEGDGYPRNMRLHEFTQPVFRVYTDDEGQRITARTIVPPGEEPAVLHVMNGGIYRENATVIVDVYERNPNVEVGQGTRIRTYTYPVIEIKPNEVREIAVPWPAALEDGVDYDLYARMVVHEAPHGFSPGTATSPDGTNARFPDYARQPLSPANATSTTVKSFFHRELVAINAAGSGFPIDVCESTPVPGTECTGLFAAKKGTPRVLRVGVTNVGNAPETAVATLHLTQGGFDKTDAILDGAERDIKDILPEEVREMTWSLGLNDPGIYTATITFQLPDGRHVAEPVERMLFVQQTTGLICFDDFNTNRECGPAFTSDLPLELYGRDLTAVAVAQNGTLYVTSEISHLDGGLYARYPDGGWTKLVSLDNRSLAARFAENRPDLGFGSIRDITLATDGWIYLTGDNATALRYALDGRLQHLPKKDIGPAPLKAFGSGDGLVGYVGVPFLLTGGSTGGVAPVNHNWTPIGDKAADVTLSATNTSDVFATFNETGQYQFILNATDAKGTREFAHVNVTVLDGVVPTPEHVCGAQTRLISDDADIDGGARGAATEIKCLRGAQNTNAEAGEPAFRFLIDVAGKRFDETRTGNVTYVLKYETGTGTSNRRQINVTWNGDLLGAQFINPANGRHIGRTQPTASWYDNVLVVSVPNGQQGMSVGNTKLTGISVTAVVCDDRAGSGCTPEVRDRVPDAGGASYDSTGVVSADSEYPRQVGTLEVERVYNGTVQLSWPKTVDNQTAQADLQYLVQRSPAGRDEYVILANLTDATTWLDEAATPGRAYTYRVAAQDIAGHVGPASAAVAGSGRVFEDFRAAGWFNDTLQVVASWGQLHVLNGTRLDPVNLTTPKGLRFTDELYAFTATDTHAYVGGDEGHLFVYDGEDWTLTERGDRVRVGDGKECTEVDAAEGMCLRRITTLAVHDGRVYAAGEGGLSMVSTAADSFERLDALPLSGTPPTFTHIFPTHLGSLFFVTEDGAFWECEDCAGAQRWIEHAVSVPYIPDETGRAQPADVRGAASSEGVTALVGDGGLVMEFQDLSVYDNQGGWTTVAPLVPSHGGAVEAVALSEHRAAWRGIPEINDFSRSETLIRVTVNHFVVSASNTAPAEVRVVSALQPSTTQVTIQNNFHSCPTFREGDGSAGMNTYATVCYETGYASQVRKIFTEPSKSAGWQRDVIDFPLKSMFKAGSIAVDLVADQKTVWSVDDVVVEAISTDAEGKETSTLLLSYYGPDAPACTDSLKTFCNKGTWAPSSSDYRPTRDRVVYECDENTPDACGEREVPCPDGASACNTVPATFDPSECVVDDKNPLYGMIVCRPHETGALGYGLVKWLPMRFEAADVDPVSAWHITRSLADRPVWAINDAVWHDAPGGARPHLRDNWNMRLVSPVLDLRNAYDPVLEFKHLYAFRADIQSTTATAADGGRVEVQYLARGEECGPAVPATETCWSGFYPIEPVGGYPNASQLGLMGITEQRNDRESKAEFRPFNGSKVEAYWGRTATINEQGYIGDVADTSNYQTARFRLVEHPRLDANGNVKQDEFVNRILDEEGNVVNLSGRYVRVAFHVATYHGADRDSNNERQSNEKSKYNHTKVTTPESRVSYGGEGWYLTDIKLQGANALGVDLVATDLRFDVGYDVDRIGVGPGQRVPVNITVRNAGVFEALGYTGELEIRRVLDPVLGRTEIVDTLTLGQQPVLDAGQARNHTFFWNVPAHENDQYVLRASIIPIGIERDEDWTDNTQNLGSVLTPVLARTTKEFHVEFDVTPEDATSDITRYLPTYIVNTGNVPLRDIRVTRIINELPIAAGARAATSCEAWEAAGKPKPTVDCREWFTDAPAPAGTRTALGSLDAEFEPVEDLFWKAPARATYSMVVDAEAAADGLRSVADKRVSAFATFLFDDIEAGVRGESIAEGGWNLTGGWAPSAPGFRSAESYAFGDVSLKRYPANADAVALTPIVDLSNARSAQLAFYHKYDFESVFDAGLVEASVDGGKTWTPIAPIKDAQNGLPDGYPNTPIVASSVLHPNGDPSQPLHGFTGSSSTLPINTDGWILSQFDLTSYPGVTRYNVPYEAFDLTPLDNASYGLKERNGKPTYLAPRWEVGAIDDYRYWEVENLTENRISNRVGAETFWWAGSTSLIDDDYRPLHVTSFEGGMGGWAAQGAHQLDRVRANSKDGDFHLRLTSAGGNAAAVASIAKGPAFAVKEGMHLQTELWVQRSANRNVVVQLEWLDEEGDKVSTTTLATVNADRYQQVRVGAVAPAGVTHARLSIGYAGSAAGEYVDLDHIHVQVIERPAHNLFLHVPVDLRDIDKNSPGVVEIEWWEWADRTNMKSLYVPPSPQNFAGPGQQPAGTNEFIRGAFTWTANTASHTWRLNITEPQVIERDGNWYRMVAELDSDYKGEKFDVIFVYSTVTENPGEATVSYLERFRDDPGFAIDGFTVRQYRTVNGQPTDVQTLYDETKAWKNSFVLACLEDWPSNAGSSDLPCIDRNIGRAQLERGPVPEGAPTWTLRDEPVRALPSNWYVTEVKDEEGKATLPTGEPVKAFYTGNATCFRYNSCQYPLEYSRDCAPAATPVVGDQRVCPVPTSEGRLVTPSIDMGVVAGENAEFVFTHRFAFHNDQALFSKHHPLASGGVVEVQVFDPQTGEWGAWKQLFNESDVADKKEERADIVRRYGMRAPECCFGYTGYTTNNTTSAAGGPYQLNPPFEPVRDETSGQDFMYLFTGVSGNAPGNGGKEFSPKRGARVLPEWELGQGWIQSRFDVSEYIGKEVRFGFHYAFSGYPRTTQGGAHCLLTDSTNDICESGWWIRDVSLEGNVLAGQPVQLRLRAGTDGTVQDGGWLVDDIGLFGARYENNVGVFVDESKAPFGAVKGDTEQIPVTVRNLGSTVRRGLAVEVIQLNAAANPTLNFTSDDAPVAMWESGAVPVFRIAEIDLAPGDSKTFILNVTAPETFGALARDQQLLLILKEYNSNAKQYTNIADNEVQGFLRADVPFTLRTNGDLEVKTLTTLPASPVVDEVVTLSVPLRNFGFTPVTFNVTCVAETVDRWKPVDHSRKEIPTYLVAGSYPCERVLPDGLVSGLTRATLAPQEEQTLKFQATPTKDGFLRFRLEAVYWDGFQEFKVPEESLGASVSVGKPAVVFQESFSNEKDVDENWTRLNFGYYHSKDQGNRERSAMLLGIRDTGEPGSASGIYVGVTPPVDLRNMTDAYLTFWHLDKMAKGDGGHVRAQILINENRPGSASSWAPSGFTAAPGANGYDCLLTPEEGYEGPVASTQQQQVQPADNSSDANPAHPPTQEGYSVSRDAFFVSPHGVPDSEWDFEVVDLTKAVCPFVIDGETKHLRLVDHVVRFQFAMFAGPTNMPTGVNRGMSYGMYIDDVSVGAYRLNLKPEDGQRGLRLLDNSTKTFHVLVENLGSATDLVQVVYDAANSTAPPGSVQVPAEPIMLAPGESQVVPVQVTLPRDPTLLAAEYEVRVEARSLFDANAAGTTVLELLFAPREWAELRVAVQPPARAVQEGTESFIPVVIENTGLVASVPSVVEITDRWTDPVTGEERQRVTRLDLPSMSSYFRDADDSRRTLEFIWRPEAGSLGDHQLTFVVDPQVLGEEYTRTNNVVTITAPVVKLLIPDLSLEHSDALVLRNNLAAPIAGVVDGEVVRYEVTTGELLSFQVKVRNLGAGGVTNVDVRTFIGQLSLPAKTVPFIAPGGEVTVGFNWVAQKGEYPIEVVLRSEQVEVSSSNNRYPVTGVILLTVKDYEVEVALDAPEAILEPGTEVPLPFRLTNTGNAGEEIRLEGRLPSGWGIVFPRPEMYLRAGETYEDVATLLVPDAAVAGEQFISMVAVSRENPMKVASSETTVQVRAFHEGRVLSSVATVTPPSFVLPVRLVNEGNSLQPWNVNLSVPAGWTLDAQLPLQVSVPAYGEATVDVRVHVPPATTPGLREVLVNATLPSGESREGKIAVEIKERRGAALTLASEVPREVRGGLSYAVDVSNVGNVRQPFRLVLMDAPEGMEIRVEPSRFELAPGQTATATMRVAPDATLANGAYDLRLYALFDGVHPDTPEGRANLHDLEVDVARPDLAVVDVEATPRADVGEGDRVVVRAMVANHGAAPATDLPVHLYVDDVFVAEVRLATLLPGETLPVELNWTAVAGEHTLTVVVDPYGDKLDATTEDHSTAVQVDVQDSGPLGPNAAGRLNGIPAPGLFGLFAALAAAMMIATRRRRRAK